MSVDPGSTPHIVVLSLPYVSQFLKSAGVLGSTGFPAFFLKVKLMLTPSVEMIFLVVSIVSERHMKHDVQYPFVPEFLSFSFQALFTVKSYFLEVEILPNDSSKLFMRYFASTK